MVKLHQSMMANGGEILFVSHATPDDEIRRLLLTRGFQITAVDNVHTASQIIGQTRLAAIVIDLGMGPNALTLLHSIRADEETKVLSTLAIGEWGTGAPTVALTAGADAYEPTPLSAESLLDSIERILIKRGLAAGVND